MFTAYESGSLIGAICHGVLGLINIKNKDGELLIKNRKMTGVTNKQLQELGIFFTPMHPDLISSFIYKVFAQKEWIRCNVLITF